MNFAVSAAGHFITVFWWGIDGGRYFVLFLEAIKIWCTAALQCEKRYCFLQKDWKTHTDLCLPLSHHCCERSSKPISVPPSVLLRIIWSLNYQDFSKIERGIRLIHPRCHSSLVSCSSSSHFLSLSSAATLQRKNLTILHCRNWQSAGSSFLKSKITPE